MRCDQRIDQRGREIGVAENGRRAKRRLIANEIDHDGDVGELEPLDIAQPVGAVADRDDRPPPPPPAPPPPATGCAAR